MTKKEKLINAASATEKFFSDSTTNKSKSKNNQKKVFSFRSDADDVAKWRGYAKVKGVPVDELGTLAMSEYIENHPMSEAEETVLNSII